MKTREAIYYVVAKKYQDWRGIRYFRYVQSSGEIIQVCVSPGKETKRGRGNVPGISVLSPVSFLGNYLAYDYAVPCQKREYDKIFNKVVEALRR